jgi:Bacteriophage HK97-gp10, putative tail-component
VRLRLRVVQQKGLLQLADASGIPSTRELERRIMQQAVRPALEVIGADLAGEAAREAPVEEGTLRGSISHDVRVTPSGMEVVVTADTVYAARQHEEVTWKHPKGGKAKYMSDPLKAKAGRYATLIAGFVRKVT